MCTTYLDVLPTACVTVFLFKESLVCTRRCTAHKHNSGHFSVTPVATSPLNQQDASVPLLVVQMLDDLVHVVVAVEDKMLVYQV